MSILDDYQQLDLDESQSYFQGSPKIHKKKSKIKESPKVLQFLDVSRDTYDLERIMSQVSPSRMSQSTSFLTPYKKFNSTRGSDDVVQRLYFQNQLAENRKNYLRGQYEYKLLNQCTFSPKINKQTQKRSLKTFLNHQRHFQIKKRESILKMKKKLNFQKNLSNAQEKFSLSPGTLSIIQKKPRKQVHSRLFHQSQFPKFRSTKLDFQCTFSPVISPPNNLKRVSSVTEMLYLDALKRKQKLKKPLKKLNKK